VQALHGRVDAEDTLLDPQVLVLQPAEHQPGGGVVTFEGHVTLTRTGAFGYTVRVLPQHELLASSVELGLVVAAHV